MTLIKWNKPSNGLEKRNYLFPSVEDFFTEFFNPGLIQKEQAGFVPATNITENENSYMIELNAPGFQKEDFNIQVSDEVLTISGQHKGEKTKKEDSFVRKEYNYGSFSRSFHLADLVNQENIAAKYENGILKLALPKNKTQIKPSKQIKVE
jgi:HSP20 family protein